MRRKGILIAIEGLDGSGKTTISKALVEWMRSRGFNAIYTAEPSTSPIGELIRSKIISGEIRRDTRIEALLFAADRLWHVLYDIEPLLGEGRIVVTDRYYFSSIAYQGALNVDIAWIRTLNKFAIKPDTAIYIDVTPEEALRRKKKEGLKLLFENIEYLRKVRRIYLELVNYGELRLVDGMRDFEEVLEEVKSIVNDLLSERGFS
ncbi:MAG: dTMP kinase [Thermoprotei archaeon]|nr:MAG: dTMP kinase [Thermoprotei archaeon]